MLFRHPACWVVLKPGAGLVAPHDGRPLSGGPGCSGPGSLPPLIGKVTECRAKCEGNARFYFGFRDGVAGRLVDHLVLIFCCKGGKPWPGQGRLFLFRRGWCDGVAPHIAVGKESHGRDWKDCSFFVGMGFLPRLITKEAYLLYIEWFRRNIESVAEF